ncbi:MAG: peptidase [Crenarchaeota archaeon]|nr:peptidase [Thermoproteota archaeon]MDA1124732.1 peptidase [Thermoproteota archaeon]
MKLPIIVAAFTLLLIIPLVSQDSFAQINQGGFQAGGVPIDGSWYVGEGLKVGDYFSYNICHVDYLDCSDFDMAMWVQEEVRVGVENKFRIQVLVYDGNKIVKGHMDVGQVAPEPTGGSEEISSYRSVYKSSISWLSAFATKEIGDLTGKGPQDFRAASWGKIGNIGGQQILPSALETIKIKAGEFDTVLVTWKTGGQLNKVWIVDDFPFPIKAKTFMHVSQGIPPVEYAFELLDYKKNVPSNPFINIETTAGKQAAAGCPTEYQKTKFNESTNTFSMIVKGAYGPKIVKQGCEIELFIDFKRMVNPTEFVDQVHYNIAIFSDPSKPPIKTVSTDEGRAELYTASGQTHRFVLAEQPPGKYTYAIIVYGTGPEHILGGNPNTSGLMTFDVEVVKSGGTSFVAPPNASITQIPQWIKNNAEWWADDQIDDASFVSGIQYLINQGIMKIPETVQGSGSGSNGIPNWIKGNAEWWAAGEIDDNTFVSGIQWLISNGIMKIS